MKYENQNGTTHIFVENGENEGPVLRAIVKASFELARPAGMGWVHFDDSQEMTDETAEQFINYAAYSGVTVIEMDYVEGRQCKTFVSRVADGHFTLANHSYERDRGTPEPMLDRANDILVGKQNVGLASTSHMYKGESLTLRLAEYGFARHSNESDWDFRKRIFPDLFKMDSGRAMEFLQGASAAEWNEMDKMLFLICVSENKGKPDHNALVKFAKGFAFDPIEMRDRQKTDTCS